MQHGREFKWWLATWRRAFRIPESSVGCGQIKQIELKHVPAKNMQLFGLKLYARHNPAGWQAFMSQGNTRLHTTHLDPADLLDSIMQGGDPLAEKQYLSLARE